MMAALGLACRETFDVEHVMNALERFVPTPTVEKVIDRAARCQVLWDGTPLATGAEEIHQSVDHFAQVGRAFVAARLGRWKQGRDLRPLVVGQVALIAQATTVVVATVLFGPHPVALGSRKERQIGNSMTSRDSR